jgi:hypothetical protein
MFDITQELMVDGNAAAGILYEVFSAEMTASPTECASCGKRGELGTLLAFIHGPGVVLRCPACRSVILRVVETPKAVYIDARGAVFLRLDKGIVHGG